MSSSTRWRRALVLWVIVRLPLPLLLLAVVPGLAGGVLAWLFTHVAYGHGLAKGIVGPWTTMVYRQSAWCGVVVGGLALAVVMPGLGRRAWFGVAAVGAVLAALFLHAWWTGLVGFLLLLGVNLWPALPTTWASLAWVPWIELLFPGPTLRVVGVPTRVATAVAAVWLGTGWFAIDAFATADRWSAEVFAWPVERLDPRIRVLARAPHGDRSEYQDVDVTPDRIVVVAETDLKLLAFPRGMGGPPAFAQLQPFWGPEAGLTMDSETDPGTGTTWFLDGPRSVRAVRWVGDRSVTVGRSVALPRPLSHVYTRWSKERNQLILVTINAVEESLPPAVILVDTPGLGRAVQHNLVTADGRRVPHIRDIEWVPTLGKLVLAPDFGTRLYLADPDTGLCEPWVEVPTLNGRMEWSAELDRLFLAMPNRFAVLVVDPHTGEIERTIPTQPGVRPLAIDAERGLLITASLATGVVLVQRLDTGAYVDSFRTVMPLVREMTLLPEEGIALLTTWSQVYAIPYATR